ncbi:MAG TPA: translation initiation factor IF-2 [Bacilli bacterium]|nr:translation initiation factor IF-2 [Bacilli bacterium]HQA55585.1 translation initiation factor IF-2 [Bacilli bacterium]
MARKGKKSYRKKGNLPNREVNVSTKVQTNKVKTKVNGGVFIYTGAISAAELAKALDVAVSEIIKFLFMQGKMITINTILDDELIGLVCLQFGYDFQKKTIVAAENFEDLEILDDPNKLKPRPSVVTIMGHVDHGKTTLIDAIRNSRLVDSEVGGISQEIGAYQKEVKGQKITFIDTPGHEAFTAMRSRGASVTDIVILVVAADDGVMPQTVEAIDHAKAAGVPIIVAINKMDKAGADPARVKNELMAHDVLLEEFGGDVIAVEISAKKKTNIEGLLDAVLLVSEIKELKANPDRFAMGTVLEASLDKNEGPKATLLVQNGTLREGDFLVAGIAYGKARRMTNEYRKTLLEATPSTPVAVIGLSEVPLAGDRFMAFAQESEAREIALKRKRIKEARERNSSGGASLDDLFNRIHEGEVQILNIIIKADSTGSAEAVKSSLEKLSNDQVKINIVRASSGGITESDVLLASASKAIIYGFNVRPSAVTRAKAEEEKVEIRLHRIIYALIEEIEAAMKGMLAPTMVEKVTGQAEVRRLFKVSKIGTIAGCMVIDGSLRANSKIRVLRDGLIAFEGKMASLQREKDQAKEVKSGFECGILIENFNDLKENDIIEGYEMVEEK